MRRVASATAIVLGVLLMAPPALGQSQPTFSDLLQKAQEQEKSDIPGFAVFTYQEALEAARSDTEKAAALRGLLRLKSEDDIQKDSLNLGVLVQRLLDADPTAAKDGTIVAFIRRVAEAQQIQCVRLSPEEERDLAEAQGLIRGIDRSPAGRVREGKAAAILGAHLAMANPGKFAFWRAAAAYAVATKNPVLADTVVRKLRTMHAGAIGGWADDVLSIAESLVVAVTPDKPRAFRPYPRFGLPDYLWRGYSLLDDTKTFPDIVGARHMLGQLEDNARSEDGEQEEILSPDAMHLVSSTYGLMALYLAQNAYGAATDLRPELRVRLVASYAEKAAAWWSEAMLRKGESSSEDSEQDLILGMSSYHPGMQNHASSREVYDALIHDLALGAAGDSGQFTVNLGYCRGRRDAQFAVRLLEFVESLANEPPIEIWRALWLIYGATPDIPYYDKAVVDGSKFVEYGNKAAAALLARGDAEGKRAAASMIWDTGFGYLSTQGGLLPLNRFEGLRYLLQAAELSDRLKRDLDSELAGQFSNWGPSTDIFMKWAKRSARPVEVAP